MPATDFNERSDFVAHRQQLGQSRRTLLRESNTRCTMQDNLVGTDLRVFDLNHTQSKTGFHMSDASRARDQRGMSNTFIGGGWWQC